MPISLAELLHTRGRVSDYPEADSFHSISPAVSAACHDGSDRITAEGTRKKRRTDQDVPHRTTPDAPAAIPRTSVSQENANVLSWASEGGSQPLRSSTVDLVLHVVPSGRS